MIPKSNEVRFEVTTRCNYHCVICPREKLTRTLEIMTFATFTFLLDKITDSSDRYEVCTFSGFGEPLLDPTLIKKIEYARKKDFNVLMLTNASLLTMDKFKAIDDLGVSSIRVSFYGNSSSTYNKIHNIRDKSSFSRIRKLLTDIRRVKKNTKLLLTYNVENDINARDAEAWIDFWKDKADLLEVWRPHNWVDGKKYRAVQDEKVRTCGRPLNTPLQVQVNGTVNMCCFDFNGQLELGDLKTESLKEIFSSPVFKKIVKHHTTGDFRKSGLICEDCDQRNADKSDVLVYDSKYDIAERVKKVSTTYHNVSGK